ncbi:putative 66.9 kDa protein R07B1.8 in chromosome X [Ditylenchus destructor]|uniref:66.9 kDa protein R07B1.8 in chromosome X n=1 Tax=Ditylenchus destructor TaxID=166010 RepID=A0AAD4NBU7_9BILA|nr:putative 66.9 kDa protein R07B1.8 in chromosome X [Ditylenchus destructor]
MAKELVGIFLGSSIAIGLKESERKPEPKRHGKSDQAITLATTEGDMLPKNAKKAASLQPVSKKKTTRKGSRDKPTHVVPACNKVKEKTLALHTLDATTDKDLKQSGYVVSNTVDPSRFTGTKTKPTIGKTATDATLDKALMNDQGYEASVTCDTSQAKTAVSKQEKVCQQENGQSPPWVWMVTNITNESKAREPSKYVSNDIYFACLFSNVGNFTLLHSFNIKFRLKKSIAQSRLVASPLNMVMIKLRKLLLLISFVQSTCGDSPCTDQLQRCGSLVEELERQIHDVKSLAFRDCFTKTQCVQEKIAFDECFGKTLKPFRDTIDKGSSAHNDNLTTISQSYKSQMEQCFLRTNNAGGTTTAPDITSIIVDEDAVYARTIYTPEFADSLWGLVETQTPSIDPQGACLAKDVVTRVFGGGISRIVDSSNPTLNNLNTSCMLSTEELSCYRRTLDENREFHQLIENRDKVLRSCVQSVRLHSGCRKADKSRVRPCVCNARDELENRLLTEVYTAIIEMSNGVIPENFPIPTSQFRFKQSTAEPNTAFQHSDDPITVSSTATITPGVMLNGQCLCTCNQHKQTSSGDIFVGSSSDTLGPVSGSSSRFRTSDQVDGSSRSGSGPASAYYTQQWRQSQPSSSPWYYPPITTAMSTESGIANGFERFFSGMPPIRRRRSQNRINDKH